MDYTITRADLNNCQYDKCSADVLNENYIEVTDMETFLRIVCNIVHKEGTDND